MQPIPWDSSDKEIFAMFDEIILADKEKPLLNSTNRWRRNALIKRERKSSQVFRKLACDATGQTSAQVVASSELPPVDSIYRVHWLPLVPMLLRGRKDLHRLVFCVQTTRKLSQVEKNLRWNLNKLKLVASHRKVIASWRSNETQAKTCDDLRSRLIRA